MFEVILVLQPNTGGIGIFAPQSPRISSPARSDAVGPGNFGGGGRGRGRDQRDTSIIGKIWPLQVFHIFIH